MAFKALLILVVVAVLMEDGSSIKKTAEEEKEDEEVARAVNKTLAEEEKKRQEEEDEKKRQEDEKKKMKTKDEKKKTDSGSGTIAKKEDEASPSNVTCPVIRECESCPDTPSCPPCERCPEVPGPQHNVTCRNTTVTRVITVNQTCPISPSCPENNNTQSSSIPDCPEVAEVTMSVPVAMLVGACASLLVTGMATAIGLLLRYVDPIVSGFFFVATVVLIWYFSSRYPETARDLGARAATLLGEAATALSHRIMEALRHHNNQVGFS
jgi:hypothetical protein